MRCRCLALFVLLSVSCRASGVLQDTVDGATTTRARYAVSTGDLPPGCRLVRLRLPIPAERADRHLAQVRANGLSGNRAFDLGPEQLGQAPFTRSSGGILLTFEPGPDGPGRALVLETPGRPLELTLRFDVRYASSAAVADARPELLELCNDATLEVDGTAWSAPRIKPLLEDPGGRP